MAPHAKTMQLLSANPLALSFDRLMPRLELIKKYLPELEHMYTATRVSDIKNKTVEQLRKLKDIGVNEISLGVESGDDWTLKRINKGYTSQDIQEQCHKLEEAGIQYWVTFLNGVAGREHSHEQCQGYRHQKWQEVCGEWGNGSHHLAGLCQQNLGECR